MVPVVFVVLTVTAVMGKFPGTRMTEQSELMLPSVCARIGMLTMGTWAPDVTTLGRRVVLFVFVTTIRKLWFVVLCLQAYSWLGAWRVSITCALRVMFSLLRTRVVLCTAV